MALGNPQSTPPPPRAADRVPATVWVSAISSFLPPSAIFNGVALTSKRMDAALRIFRGRALDRVLEHWLRSKRFLHRDFLDMREERRLARLHHPESAALAALTDELDVGATQWLRERGARLAAVEALLEKKRAELDRDLTAMKPPSAFCLKMQRLGSACRGCAGPSPRRRAHNRPRTLQRVSAAVACVVLAPVLVPCYAFGAGVSAARESVRACKQDRTRRRRDEERRARIERELGGGEAQAGAALLRARIRGFGPAHGPTAGAGSQSGFLAGCGGDSDGERAVQ